MSYLNVVGGVPQTRVDHGSNVLGSAEMLSVRFISIASLIIATAMSVACASRAALDTTAVPPTMPPPTAAPSLAHLTTVETTVKRFREDSSVVVEKGATVPIEANDRIAVEDEGWGLLRFLDNLVIDIYRDSTLQLSDAQIDPQGFLFFRLKQILGSTRVELNQKRDARLELVTDHATMTADNTLDGNTEFVVCHAPEIVTCMVTLDGEVAVAAQGETVTVEAGEATYIFPGEPPGPPICVVMEEFEAWLNKERTAEKVEPLGVIVANWPQEPCSVASASPTVTKMALPSGEGMVYVDAGQYTIGVPEPDDFHSAAQQVTIDGFWIDAFEVTNAQYQTFVNDTNHAPPLNWPPTTGREDHPLRGVTWDDANAYCAWANKRLPTEAEWEVAARGTGDDPPLYPWGSDPLAEGQLDAMPQTDTYQVGTVAFNVSAFGVYDQAGNVWEWVAQPYAPVQDDNKILRGGRHGLIRDMAYRQQATADAERFVPFAGFRCAADQIEGE